MKRYFFTLFLLIATFSTMAQPKVYTPTLKSPVDNATLQMPNVYLSWNAITGSYNLQYEVVFDTTTNFNSPLLIDTVQTLLTGYQTHNLFFGQKYFWRVRAIDAGETSAWTPIWSFTVFSYFELGKPQSTDTVQNPDATVEWKKTLNSTINITGITNIDYQIDTTVSFNSPLLISLALSGDPSSYSGNNFAYTNMNLRFGTTYFWRVRARHEGGSSPWPTGWVTLLGGTTADLMGAAFTSATSGFIVGNAGTILKTTDGGQSWTKQTSGTTNNLSAVFASNANVYVVGDGGIIRKSSNGGTTWTQDTSGVTVNLKGVTIKHDSVGYAVGSSGTILKTFKGLSSKKWISDTSGTSADLMGVAFPVDTIGYAVGLNGTIVKKTKQNVNWVTLVSGTTNDLYGVYFFNVNTGIAFGEAGTILKTTDGGTTWTTIVSGTTSTLYAVSFIGTTNGYLVGAGGVCLRTTNGGNSWSALNPGITEDIHAVSAPSAAAVFIAGNNGKILITTTSGRPWTFRTIKSPTLKAPANNLTNQMIDVVLTWDKVTGILAYQYEIATDPAFVNIIDASEADTNGFQSLFLRFGTKYYWRVNARHLTDTSDWTATFNFTTIATVILKTPTNGSTNVPLRPTLVWTAQTGIAGYELQLDTLDTFVYPDTILQTQSRRY